MRFKCDFFCIIDSKINSQNFLFVKKIPNKRYYFHILCTYHLNDVKLMNLISFPQDQYNRWFVFQNAQIVNNSESRIAEIFFYVINHAFLLLISGINVLENQMKDIFHKQYSKIKLFLSQLMSFQIYCIKLQVIFFILPNFLLLSFYEICYA